MVAHFNFTANYADARVILLFFRIEKMTPNLSNPQDWIVLRNMGFTDN
jgi:hypothetical protein